MTGGADICIVNILIIVPQSTLGMVGIITHVSVVCL